MGMTLLVVSNWSLISGSTQGWSSQNWQVDAKGAAGPHQGVSARVLPVVLPPPTGAAQSRPVALPDAAPAPGAVQAIADPVPAAPAPAPVEVIKYVVVECPSPSEAPPQPPPPPPPQPPAVERTLVLTEDEPGLVMGFATNMDLYEEYRFIRSLRDVTGTLKNMDVVIITDTAVEKVRVRHVRVPERVLHPG